MFGGFALFAYRKRRGVLLVALLGIAVAGVFGLGVATRLSRDGDTDPSSAALLGTGATAWGVVGAASSLLQALKLVRTESAESVSVGFLATYLVGYVTWALYGMAIGNTPLIVVDIIGICASAVTVGTALRVRRAATRTNGSHRSEAASHVEACT